MTGPKTPEPVELLDPDFDEMTLDEIERLVKETGVQGMDVDVALVRNGMLIEVNGEDE
jgi:hypothetical protein